jgi:hypothetical protein
VSRDSDFLFLENLSFQVCDGRVFRYATALPLYEIHQTSIENIRAQNDTSVLICKSNDEYESHKDLLHGIVSVFEAYYHFYVFDRLVKNASNRFTSGYKKIQVNWPAPGSEDTELGVLMEPEVGHGEAEVYTRVQA